MAELSRDEVVGVLGRLSDVIIAEIIATGISRCRLSPSAGTARLIEPCGARVVS